jgi:glutaminase
MVAADGKSYAIGDCDVPFTIQSISKAFVFGLALQDHGRDFVLSKVGVEPTGEAFNSIIFDERGNRPLNPMVNTGAIATTALVNGEGLQPRFDRILRFMERFSGRPLGFDHAVSLSEKATGHRNRAIGHLELNFGMIDDRVDEHLNLYFQQCAILVTARDLGMMAATLANGGINPITGERALDERYVKYVIAVMSTCGMYNFAGEWLYRVGLPAKSGVGGGIMAVLPGQLGIGTFSPPLDEHGNSVRGIKVCEDLSESFGLHMFAAPNAVRSAVARHYRGDKVSSERVRSTSDRSVLESDGGAIAVYELQGDLILASAEQLIRRVVDDCSPTRFIILDCKRVWRIDRAAAALIHQTVQAQGTRGRALVLTGLSRNGRLQERLVAAGVERGAFFDSLDDALEWSEDKILAGKAAPQSYDRALPLSQMEILAGLSETQMAVLSSSIESMRYPAGSIIFHEGDKATQVYFLASGRASIFVMSDDGVPIRLAGISAGATFGEMAPFDGKPRSAGVRADTDIGCYALSLHALDQLRQKDPAALSIIISNLVCLLSLRLRRADVKLKALE